MNPIATIMNPKATIVKILILIKNREKEREMISTIFKTISCIFKILFLYSKYLVDYLKKI
jgi:hypothetical protein